MENTRETIQRLTGMSDYRYNELQFEVGLSFLQHECFYDEQSVKLMQAASLFWKWWRNIYTQRNEMWIKQAEHKNYESYTQWQSVENINVYPNRFIYEQAYSELTAKIR